MNNSISKFSFCMVLTDSPHKWLATTFFKILEIQLSITNRWKIISRLSSSSLPWTGCLDVYMDGKRAAGSHNLHILDG